MTYGEVLAQIISEITGKPKEQINEIVKSVEKAFPDRQRLQEVVPEEKVELLLNELRKEKQTILAQLIEYGLIMEHNEGGNA
ncbi:MAG TPA: hypothetical protein VJ161_00295 [Geobacteraceae bacterium]|nr:hypothetical protein [Geobacteraceae bacterium]